MAYIINKYSGEQLIALEDGTIDTTTSVGLVGRNYVGYGEIQNENFLFLLENFANDTPPPRPLEGQHWFNSVENVPYVFDGTNWNPIGFSAVSSDPPLDPNQGTLWVDTKLDQLKIWVTDKWAVIGPDAVEGFKTTRARSAALIDQDGQSRPVIFLETDANIFAICTAEAFSFIPNINLPGFSGVLSTGINLAEGAVVQGNILGNATSADKLANARLINGVPFDAQSNITIKASTTNRLIRGTYISGSTFDGSAETTWSVDATSANEIGKIVARNSFGGFSAGIITATFVGNLTGNVTVASGTSSFNRVEATEFVGGSLIGNASSASQLAISRKINGVNFNGTIDINVPAAAQTLTGNILSSTVTESNLTSLGTLTSLSIADAGISIGASGVLRFLIDSNIPTLRSPSGKLNVEMGPTGSNISFIDTVTSVSLGGPNAPAIKGDNATNLGIPGHTFNNVYANYFKGADAEIDSLTPSSPSNTITANGNFIITGGLTVQGNLTAINSTELTIEDKLITLANGAATPAEASGSGIFISGADASLLYTASGNKWVLNKPLDVGANDVTTTGLFRGTATSAQYADLAENYVADANYEPGTVLEIGGDFEVTLAQDGTTKIAGVVSTNPAYLMNSHCQGEHVVAIALQGRTPCKVKGKIRKGDMLISAGRGYARPTLQPQIGTIIGKALEDFDGIAGTIEVLVSRV
jgi:hypothetical protein